MSAVLGRRHRRRRVETSKRRRGTFNLQCKCLSISTGRDQRWEVCVSGVLGWWWVGGGGATQQSFNPSPFFVRGGCCCYWRAGRGWSGSPLFLNCEARRLVRVLPTFHPKQRSHQIQLPSDTRGGGRGGGWSTPTELPVGQNAFFFFNPSPSSTPPPTQTRLWPHPP